VTFAAPSSAGGARNRRERVRSRGTVDVVQTHDGIARVVRVVVEVVEESRVRVERRKGLRCRAGGAGGRKAGREGKVVERC
jgi:hypothetical protein